MYIIAENVHRRKKFAKPRYLCIAETIPSGKGCQIIYVIINTEALKRIHRPVGRGGACAPPFCSEIYKQQYEYRCPQGSHVHQPNLRSLATH